MPSFKRIGDLIVSTDAPEWEHFALSPAWYLYDEPGEVAEMIAQGATQEWIQANIFDVIAGTNNEIYYASVRGPIGGCHEFSEIAATIDLGTSQIPGYVVFVGSEPSSVGLLLSPAHLGGQEAPPLLSGCDQLIKENKETLLHLATALHCDVERIQAVRYELSVAGPSGSLRTGELLVPSTLRQPGKS